MTFDLSHKTIVVTGATSGIGRACAIALAEQGAWVAVAGRDEWRGRQTLLTIREAGGDGMFLRFDVTEHDAWNEAIHQLMQRRGELHGLVNNAGDSILKRLDLLLVEDFEFLLAINYQACFLGMRVAFPQIRASGGGVVVNVSSVAGIRAGWNSTGYGTTKAAMTGLTREAAQIGLSTEPKIRVNSIHPGLIWGPGVSEALGEKGAQDFKRYIVGKTPVGRVGAADDVAKLVVFLMSDSAASIAGQEFVVDGGLRLAYP